MVVVVVVNQNCVIVERVMSMVDQDV